MIKYVVGIGRLLTNKFLVYDGLNMKFSEFKLEKDPSCEHCSHWEVRRAASNKINIHPFF